MIALRKISNYASQSLRLNVSRYRLQSSILYDKEDDFGNFATFGRKRPQRRQDKYSEGYTRDFNRKDSHFEDFSQLKKPSWDNTLEKVQKNFYVEQDIVKNRSDAEIELFLKEREIRTSGNDVPRPVFRFSEITFPEYIRKTISTQNWEEPTAIQAQGLPMAMSGFDMVGRARTGSGKTAAFLLPGIVHIRNQPPPNRDEGPICLVLVPTRELAQQVGEVAKQFGWPARLKYATVYGGSSRHYQLDQLNKGPEICIATPGRLLDFLQFGQTNLARCSYLVLDEADRMLDMGFEPQIRKIVEQTRPDRQTLMFSATWPDDVKELAQDFLLPNSLQVMIGSGKLHANKNIKQLVDICSEDDKISKLYDILCEISKKEEHKTLIFVSTKKKADYLARIMKKANWPAAAIHGDKSQSQRDSLLRAFRNGDCSFMIATDVASRGLDVSDIKYVINYDMPTCIEDYVHRIGRTARAENTGTSYTMFTDADADRAKDLIEILTQANQTVPDELFELVNRQSQIRGKAKRRFGDYSKPQRQYGYKKRGQYGQRNFYNRNR